MIISKLTTLLPLSGYSLTGPRRRRWNPPFLAALGRHVLRPAQIDRWLEIARQERRHPSLATDAAARALVELGSRLLQLALNRQQIEHRASDRLPGQEHSR